MYRAITLKVLEEGIDPNQSQQVIEVAKKTEIRFKKVGNQERVILDNRDVTDKIRTNEVSNNVSLVAKIKEVRGQLVKLQRKMAARGGIVMDGRDIGTVVLPAADLKVFLTATVEERTTRRYEDLRAKGEEVEFQKLKSEIIRRDEIDKNREISPLKKAEDAHEIDTTNLSISEVVDKIMSLSQEV
jgi:cytidylate kinase